MYNDFKFPFEGLENIEQSYSQALQDMWVLSVLNGKRNGTFLEIGAFHPSYLSNTYLLEKYFGWTGISIDIDPSVEPEFRKFGRNGKFITGDATELDYHKILQNFPNGRCDYLQIDTDPMQISLSVLKKILFDECKFSLVTYETDFYDSKTSRPEAERVRQESRDILQSHGYVLVNANVENLGNDAFEDWYISQNLVDESVIRKFMREEDTPPRARDYMLRNAI